MKNGVETEWRKKKHPQVRDKLQLKARGKETPIWKNSRTYLQKYK